MTEAQAGNLIGYDDPVEFVGNKVAPRTSRRFVILVGLRHLAQETKQVEFTCANCHHQVLELRDRRNDDVLEWQSSQLLRIWTWRT